MKELTIGLTGSADTKVDPTNTAEALGSGGLAVFSTPSMIMLMEKAAYYSVTDFLEDDETTVGTSIEIKHLAATPVGMNVRAESVLLSAEGKRMTFEVRAYDDAGLIGSGVHERALVKSVRFMEKAAVRGKQA